MSRSLTATLGFFLTLLMYVKISKSTLFTGPNHGYDELLVVLAVNMAFDVVFDL